MDDDDELCPEFLNRTLEKTKELPEETGAIGVGRVIIYPDGKKIYDPPKENWISFYTSIDDGFLIKREAINQVLYDEELLADEDADFGLRFCDKFN